MTAEAKLKKLDKQYYHILETNIFGWMLTTSHPLPPSAIYQRRQFEEILARLPWGKV